VLHNCLLDLQTETAAYEPDNTRVFSYLHYCHNSHATKTI